MRAILKLAHELPPLRASAPPKWWNYFQSTAVAHDIIRLKGNEARLEDALEEARRALAVQSAALRQKNVELCEADHRIKNSLQMVGSLIYLQGLRSDEPALKAALATAGSRVQAIAHIHDRLSRFDGAGQVEMKSYLAQLCDGLDKAGMIDPSSFALNLNMETLPLGGERAAPLGLIANELLTNVFQHAAIPGRIVNIRLRLRLRGSAVVFTLHDDGPGLPEKTEGSPASLGMVLVHKLVAHLGGRFKMKSSGDGVRASVVFIQ